ncbi:Os12g0592832 [Oryza sativa Japonica Group]|uniref:Os12g0592832 protein n=1 Tax=Oryza sativa subsp. japonica TaxID=39947 RepID=A0A0P0YCF2_ORYSJ|nr:Os12g0592832 [Oryza sativa Japonica Group]
MADQPAPPRRAAGFGFHDGHKGQGGGQSSPIQSSTYTVSSNKYLPNNKEDESAQPLFGTPAAFARASHQASVISQFIILNKKVDFHAIQHVLNHHIEP